VGRSVETAPPASQNSRRVEKRRVREERRPAQVYQVPSEASSRRDMRPVIVVRPLRLEAFR
jgi:hypothetical protein